MLQIQEFMVLGSQPLTMLKDRVYCLTNKLMEKAEKYDPSGYFLFEVQLLNFFFSFVQFGILSCFSNVISFHVFSSRRTHFIMT